MTQSRRVPEPIRAGRIIASVIAILLAFGAGSAIAADDEDEENAEAGGTWYQPPTWVNQVGLSGRYAGIVGGSEAKYLEDHNIQSGPVFSLGVEEDVLEDGTLFVEGMVEPLQDQGYLLFDFNQAEAFRVHADIQAWREFYNTRTGEEDETVFGTQLSGTGIFPNSNNSTHFFGGGKPKVDWLRTRSGIVVDLPGPFSNLSADFVYRRIKGEASLLKGGTVLDLAAPPVAGSGPGTVSFDISGRKQIDYETIGGVLGLGSSLGGVNLRIDASGMNHQLKSTVYEANFAADAASSELELFGRDTTINIVNGDIVVSRNLRHDLFVFGGTSFSWERSEPDPSQSIQTGILSAAPTRVRTRQTQGSAEVTRFSEAVSGGVVYTPVSNLIVRASANVRASQSEANLNESRAESAFFPPGDIGTILNESERDTVSARVRVKGDWKVARRVSVSGVAQYDFRYEDVNSSRVLNFVVFEAPQLEDYTNERSQVLAGVSGRYRMRRGRTIEGGYEFTYVGFQSDVNTIENQFIAADYERLRHRLHAKAVGRITNKLRGEMRFQYIFENRTLDAPNVQPPDITVGGDGEIEFHGFTIVPVLTYQHDEHWSGVMSVSIGRQEYKLVDDGSSPAGFSSTFAGFEYEALTETATIGVNWVPNERVRNGLSYTIYHNSESVENLGHDATIRSAFALDDHWDLDGKLRYLSFSPGNNNTVDDYHTIIVSLGLTGRF